MSGESGTPEAILSRDQWRAARDALTDGPDLHVDQCDAYLALEEHDAALRAEVERLTAERDEEIQWRIRVEARVAALTEGLRELLDAGDVITNAPPGATHHVLNRYRDAKDAAHALLSAVEEPKSPSSTT